MEKAEKGGETRPHFLHVIIIIACAMHGKVRGAMVA
jgi:hypothetical protein